MFRVVIIDDESIIRQGLHSMVPWAEFDCEVCGEAEDGTDGMELIADCKPDIIFTDIKMQEMDGLTMIRNVREMLPFAKIIILTGYRDFEYARDALQLGVFDFLLKPSRPEDIRRTLEKTVKELKREQRALQEREKAQQMFEESMPELHEKFLYNIMCGICFDTAEIREKAAYYRLQLNDYLLVVAERDREDADSGAEPQGNVGLLYRFNVKDFFLDVFSEYDVISVTLYSERLAFILRPSDKLDEVCDLCARFQESIRNCFDITVSIGISTKGSNIFELRDKWKECLSALQHKLYIGAGSLVCYQDLRTAFRYEGDTVLGNYRDVLLEAVKQGNVEGARENLELIFQYLHDRGLQMDAEMKRFYWNTISSVNSIRISVMHQQQPEKQDSGQEPDSLFSLIHSSDSIADLNELLKDVVIHEAERVNQFNHKSISLKVQTIIEYVENHYHEPITLNDIGECIYTSTYYASRIFKQETGKNFTDYLNEFRIEKAKEFLMDVQNKVYEVADMVGIPDAHYFSKLFRKYVGLTPREYRDSVVREK